MEKPLIKLDRKYRAFTLILNLVLLAAFVLLPTVRNQFTQEGHFIRILTALLFVGAFTAGVYELWTRKGEFPKVYLLLPLFGLLGFLDEISYGLFLFNRNGRIIHDVSIDSAFDIFDLSIRTLKPVVPSALLYLGVFLVAFLVILSFKLLIDYQERCAPLDYLLAAIVYLVFASVISLDLVGYWLLLFFEAVFKLNAALALFFSCLAIKSGMEEWSSVTPLSTEVG